MSRTGPGTTAASTDHWLGALSEAHHSPRTVAERWSSGGGRVVGVFGACAPRELVAAAGMLPVRLDAARLCGGGQPKVPDGLGAELSAGPLALLSALLGGGLGWLDALLIGRDSEAHTKLFYVVREMAADPEFAPLIPPFAFSDLLRLPRRTSSIYNRLRLRQLAAVVCGWAGREPDAAALRSAIQADALVGRSLRELRGLQRRGLVTARDMLVAERGAQALPSDAAQSALEAAIGAARSREPGGCAGPRIFVTGSEPEPGIYSALEARGLRIVGSDQEWERDDFEASAATEDPIDWLADRYQFSSSGAARAGLERVGRSVARVRELGADAVLQLIAPGDEASVWELPELRRLLAGMPVVSAELGPQQHEAALEAAVASLLDLLGAPAASASSAAVEGTRG